MGRKFLWKLGMIALAAAIPTAAFSGADDAFGTWRNPENGSLIKLYPCDGGLCAQIVQTSNPDAKDEKNPDPAKRDRKVQGLVIMNGAKKTGENSWKGELYNREDGKTYSGNITVLSKDQVKLEGCALLGIICRGVTWTRVGI